jgi:hypothetical protein
MRGPGQILKRFGHLARSLERTHMAGVGEFDQCLQLGQLRGNPARVCRRREPVIGSGHHHRRQGQPRERRVQIHVGHRETGGGPDVGRAAGQHALVERDQCGRRGGAETDVADERV